MSTTLSWPEQLRTLRTRLGYDQEEMGRELGLSREWVSKLETGRETPSERVRLKAEKVAAAAGLNILESGFTSIAHEDPAPYGHTSQIQEELRRQFEALLAAAGEDRNRLGWVAEQLRLHLAVPAHWHAAAGPFVPVKLPSQHTALSTATGQPQPKPSPHARRA